MSVNRSVRDHSKYDHPILTDEQVEARNAYWQHVHEAHRSAGKMLRDAMLRLGLSVEDVAQSLGRNVGTIRHWGAGAGRPGQRVRQALCDLLQINRAEIDRLWDYERWNEEPCYANLTAGGQPQRMSHE